MPFNLLLGLSPVVIEAYHFGQVGVNDVHAGVQHKLVELRGHIPPTCDQKGGSF